MAVAGRNGERLLRYALIMFAVLVVLMALTGCMRKATGMKAMWLCFGYCARMEMYGEIGACDADDPWCVDPGADADGDGER